jgi:hypothetical protein
MMTHAEYSKKHAGGGCTVHHITFHGCCLNCGWSPHRVEVPMPDFNAKRKRKKKTK